MPSSLSDPGHKSHFLIGASPSTGKCICIPPHLCYRSFRQNGFMVFDERSKEGEATRERALVARLRQFIEDSDLSFYKIASRSKSLIGRHFGPDRNEAGELLIGVFSSETGKCGPECGCDRDDETAHLGVSADILNRF